MASNPTEQTVHVVEIVRKETIAAPIEIVFETILETCGPDNEMPDGSPFPMKLEAWPGGRWFRDLGNNTGHLWAHVQVIKPPKLLELSGPMFMSYPAVTHVQYRLTPEGSGTLLQLTSKSMGLMPADHREGMSMGWDYDIKLIRERSERRA